MAWEEELEQQQFKYGGSCLCGEIRFGFDEQLADTLHCHCSFCRKSHGSAFVTLGRLVQSSLHWLQGLDKLIEYASSPGVTRRFCKNCGSMLPGSWGTNFWVPVGCLDHGGCPGARMHIYTPSKAPWYDIPGTLAQHSVLPCAAQVASLDRPLESGSSKSNPVKSNPIQRKTRADTEPAITHGSCLCNQVTFQFAGLPQTMRNCHCSRCRKARSAAHASNLFVQTGSFRWTSGEDAITRFDLPDAERFGVDFCSVCGSCVPRLMEKYDLLNIPGGCLDDDPGMKPMMHIYVGSKAPWFEIEDDLPQYMEAWQS